VIADARSLPFADRVADVALAFHVLADLPDPLVGLREIKRILRPGGRCLVLETTCYPEHDLPHDYVRLMPTGLELLAQGVGLEPVALIRLGGFFARCAQLWNSFVMGWFMARGANLIGRLGILAANVLAWLLDKMFPHPRLAPDYLFVLRAVKEDPV
jgi:ubiquinone/menaquinone biosynthesis C-methylase UbiE